MGLGDELMAAGEARRLRHLSGKRVRIVDKDHRARWHELWAGSPDIARLGEQGDFALLQNGSGCRPYIDYRRTTRDRWAYTAWRCVPAPPLPVEPDARGVGYVLVEPNLKTGASPNKQWGADNWRRLTQHKLPWAQMCPPGVVALPGVKRIETRSFLEAVGVLAAARGAVLPEGGLHHAAAAMGRRVVVLFGGMVSPRNTGYDDHINLAVDDAAALGWRVPHAACASAWKQITPEHVLAALETTLEPA